MSNIVLIGMPAAGKSTIGVLLAKRMGMNFVDTDLLIQSQHGKPLHQLLDRHNPTIFNSLEEACISQLTATHTVIATGGSAIYGERGMQHLKTIGTVVYLYVPLSLLEMRLNDLVQRAVVMHPEQTLQELFEARHPLYQRWADLTIPTLGLDHEGVSTAIRNQFIQPTPPAGDHD